MRGCSLIVVHVYVGACTCVRACTCVCVVCARLCCVLVGVRGNWGGKEGKALCCDAACKQCGKGTRAECMAGNVFCLYALRPYASVIPCLYASVSPCLYVSESPCLFVSVSPCLFVVSVSPCLFVSVSPCLYVSVSPCLYVSVSPCLFSLMFLLLRADHTHTCAHPQ